MILKEKYFYIDSIQNLNIDYIKKTKANIIIKDNIKLNKDFYDFVIKCKNNLINVFISNDLKLLYRLKSNNFYISAFNKKKIFIFKKAKSSNKNYWERA